MTTQLDRAEGPALDEWLHVTVLGMPPRNDPRNGLAGTARSGPRHSPREAAAVRA